MPSGGFTSGWWRSSTSRQKQQRMLREDPRGRTLSTPEALAGAGGIPGQDI
jgi:hypothetical protein